MLKFELPMTSKIQHLKLFYDNNINMHTYFHKKSLISYQGSEYISYSNSSSCTPP